jgi:hypothetical protein
MAYVAIGILRAPADLEPAANRAVFRDSDFGFDQFTRLNCAAASGTIGAGGSIGE